MYAGGVRCEVPVSDSRMADLGGGIRDHSVDAGTGFRVDRRWGGLVRFLEPQPTEGTLA
jgi:hypothetical protein